MVEEKQSKNCHFRENNSHHQFRLSNFKVEKEHSWEDPWGKRTVSARNSTRTWGNNAGENTLYAERRQPGMAEKVLTGMVPGV